MVNTLRVKKEREYTIEVNDNGDTISFNVEDPSLPLRAEKTNEEINKILEKCKGEILILEKRKDVKPKNALLSTNQKAILEIYNYTFIEMRKVMDRLLGKGASKKIFGDTNYLSMWDDLFEQLEPHFEKMQISAESFTDSIKKKYGNKESDDTIEV